MMVSACAARLRLTLATVAADNGSELEAANWRQRTGGSELEAGLEVLGWRC